MTPTTRPVRVIQQRWEADGVASLRLVPTDDTSLPPWEPGAHIDVVLPSGRVRQYSLCGPPQDPAYTVAVLREHDGRGGSAEIHDTALLGRELQIGGPRNRFELEPAARYAFVAGGIGITPLLAMIRAVAGQGLPWELHYGGRHRATMAFTAELTELAHTSGGTITLHSDDEDGPLPLSAIVAAQPDDAMIYACGPAGMLAALTATIEGQRPTLPLRFERFTAAPADLTTADATPPHETDDGGKSFVVELAQSGHTVTVQPGQSILDAVRDKCDVMSSCEEGFCGTCETKVIAGEPIHRDSILSDKERAKNTSMMICVGSCASARLVLDL